MGEQYRKGEGLETVIILTDVEHFGKLGVYDSEDCLTEWVSLQDLERAHKAGVAIRGVDISGASITLTEYDRMRINLQTGRKWIIRDALAFFVQDLVLLKAFITTDLDVSYKVRLSDFCNRVAARSLFGLTSFYLHTQLTLLLNDDVKVDNDAFLSVFRNRLLVLDIRGCTNEVSIAVVYKALYSDNKLATVDYQIIDYPARKSKYVMALRKGG